jgi:hypothetical protein
MIKWLRIAGIAGSFCAVLLLSPAMAWAVGHAGHAGQGHGHGHAHAAPRNAKPSPAQSESATPVDSYRSTTTERMFVAPGI